MKNLDFKNLLQNAKLKNTAPRLAVLKAFAENKYPATAQEIYKKISARGGSALGGKKIDLVTLYRTIASFEKKGIVRKIDLQKDAVFYELNTEHHHHLVCTNCNKIENFENEKVEKIIGEIFRKSDKFKNINEHSFELFGLCRACA